MPTLVYGEVKRKMYGASLNIVVYQPDRRHYFNAMRLIDAIMAANRMKKGVAQYHPRIGTYKAKVSNYCSPVAFRFRKMMA